MADATKAQRLLAAKKKVKEYQKNRKTKSDFNVDNKTPAESLTNSTHSSLNEVQNLEETESSNQNIHSTSPLQQYFADGNSTVFDDINSKNKNDFYAFDLISYNTNETNKNKPVEVYIKEENHETNSNDRSDLYTLETYDTSDTIAAEDPEIEPNEIYNRLNNVNPLDDENQKVNNYFSLSPEHENSKINSNNSSYLKDVNVQENMQSLKQLSTQIIQMIDDNAMPTLSMKSDLELENKNDNMHDIVKIEQEKNLKLTEEVATYKAHIRELENESQILKENNEKGVLETRQLFDQIQCHEQTIKILVAEKSELTNGLYQNDTNLKQKTTECEELSARLKTSRSRVADLEKELNVFRTEKQDKKYLEHNAELQKLSNECQTLRNQREETMQDVSELQEKLNASTSESFKLKQEVQELTSKLSLLNIKLQQLSSGGDHQFNGHIEGLTQQINMFEKQVIDLNNVIKTLTIEKEQINIQYQQYVQQLNGQLNTLVQRLEEKSLENETLIGREKQLTNQMGDLEKLLQKLQNDQQVVINNKNGNGLKKELEETLASLNAVTQEKSLLEESYQFVIGERDDAFKDLELRKEEVNQLEEEINRLQSNQPDNVKLLATIESDKVAASRAVTQNAELKKQLEEMQQAFIQISNNKLELTELLSDQKHKNKELNDKLNQFESQIHTLTEAIEIKDREMILLRESAQEINKYIVQQNQLEDRLRHYEAHDHSTHALQRELQESYKKIQHLRSENETLKFHLKNTENKNKEFELAKAKQSEDTGEDKTVLLTRIDELERRNKEMEVKLVQLEGAEISVEETDAKLINIENIQEKPLTNIVETQTEAAIGARDLTQEIAMKQLETKFTKTMQEIADLEDEKQRLEHLVMQLQDETETIGEYVTLYQHQRGILKQRALERDDQMRQLTLDREQMKAKIDKLNDLVKMLMAEKDSIPPEMFEQHLINKSQLCEEHAKTHQEMAQPINQNGVNNNNNKTAEKIIELLGEIKRSNLVQQSSETADMFHPCPWCSGQLITV